jgi:hypothetical protein
MRVPKRTSVASGTQSHAPKETNIEHRNDFACDAKGFPRSRSWANSRFMTREHQSLLIKAWPPSGDAKGILPTCFLFVLALALMVLVGMIAGPSARRTSRRATSFA